MEIETLLQKNKIKYTALFCLLALAAAVIMLCTIHMGAMDISASDVFKVLACKLTGDQTLLNGVKDNEAAVIWEIRLPRIFSGFLVGAGLAVAGAIFQGILQNPLADPYTIGISNGASFGAAAAIYLNMSYGLHIQATAAALAAACLTLALVISIAKRGNDFDSSSLIIAGIIVSSILSAGVSLIKMMAGENVAAIVFWLMGSFSGTTWNDVALLAPSVIAATGISIILADQLDIAALGDRNAESLGVNTGRLRLVFLILGAVLTAVCVSVCGIIGFVGLVVPHLLRLWITPSNRVLIPMAALLGGDLLALADNVTRAIPSGEIPVGVLTTLIGGPFFIYVFVRK